MFRKLLLGITALVVLGAIIGGIAGKNKSNSNGPSSKSSKPAKSAHFRLLVGKSACWEDLTDAYIRCTIGVRNVGRAAGGVPDVNVLVRYSDGSSTIFTNTTDPLNNYSSPDGHKIRARTSDTVYLAHSYNEQGHSLLRAAASLNLEAKSYPYVLVKTPYTGG